MSANDDSHPHHGNETVRFEPTDVATRPVALSVLALALFTILFTVVAHFVFHGLAERQRGASPPANPLAEKYAAKEPPEPRLQLHPKTDLDVMRANEDKILNTYKWLDQNAGIVQVPIGRAMEMLAAKGLPARQGPVPLKMSPRGEAPRQMLEAEGAPDWHGGWQVSHDEPSFQHGVGANVEHGKHGTDGAHAPHGKGGAGHGDGTDPGHGGGVKEPRSEGHGH